MPKKPRDHLIPKVITDKNGHTRTVHVKADDAQRIAIGKVPPVAPGKTASDAGSDPNALRGKPTSSVNLRDYQEEIVQSVLTKLEKDDVTSSIAACGSGKTIMAQEMVRRDFDRRVANGEEPVPAYVFVTKGISLTDQSLREFDDKGVLGLHKSMTYHSESDFLPKNKRKHETNDEFQERRRRIVEDFLNDDPTDAKGNPVPRVVFVTYESAEHVARAQEESGASQAPILIMDESHHIMRTFGRTKANEATSDSEDGSGRIPRVLRNDIQGSLQSEKRVLLTATPAVNEARYYSDALTQSQESAMESRDYLRALAIHEDDNSRPKPVMRKTINHEDVHFAGTPANFLSQRDAVEKGFLKPVEQTVVRVPSNIGNLVPEGAETREERRCRKPENVRIDPMNGHRIPITEMGNHREHGVSLSTYAGAHTAIAAFDQMDDESPNAAHNMLLFLSETKDLEQFQSNWKPLLMNGVRQMPENEAWSLVDDPDASSNDKRAARRNLLARYSSVTYAHANSTPKQREAALNHFSSGNDDTDLHCACGRQKQRKWCPCKRIVANCRLFADGIDVKGIDRVVMTNPNGATTTSVNQMLGRASRGYDSKFRGEKKPAILVPAVTATENDDFRPDEVISPVTDKILSKLVDVNTDRVKADLMQDPSQIRPDDVPISLLDSRTGKTADYQSATALRGSVVRFSKETQDTVYAGYALMREHKGSRGNQIVAGNDAEEPSKLFVKKQRADKRKQYFDLLEGSGDSKNADRLFKSFIHSPRRSVYAMSDVNYDVSPVSATALNDVQMSSKEPATIESDKLTPDTTQSYLDQMREVGAPEQFVQMLIQGARMNAKYRDLDLR